MDNSPVFEPLREIILQIIVLFPPFAGLTTQNMYNGGTRLVLILNFIFLGECDDRD